MKTNLIHHGDRVTTVWSEDGSAFPKQILLDGKETLGKNSGFLTITLGDGRVLSPCVSDASTVDKRETKDCLTINFDRLSWRDKEGRTIPSFRTDLRFELWHDGTTFFNFYFLDETCSPIDIASFAFEVRPRIQGFDCVKWGYTVRSTANAADILPVRANRFLDPGNNVSMEGALMPSVSFDCSKENGMATYMEFFVEGYSTLSEKTDGCSSSITWDENGPIVRWDFQAPKYQSKQERPWQLRNQIGWVITPPPTQRNLPPLRMYHYFSNQKRYPSLDNVKKMAKNGADVLILHENWRSDTINGGTAYDAKTLKGVIETAHSHNMRIALYVRGNEQAEREEKTDWFERFLTKDYDGLYMDFGGAFGLMSPPYIDYVGGRIHFRGWYLAARERRERVGKYGLVFAHSGPTFSAVGMTGNLISGYVSGEGERGLVIKSRLHHSYYTCSHVAPGTMWTAAFPEYSTSRMIPYLASTGQYPHAPLGAQFETSSLTHPDEPGSSDIYLRPLWRLWGLFKGKQDLKTASWDNGFAGIKTDSDKTGFYMMDDQSGSRLIILSNFDENERDATLSIDPAALSITGCTKAFALCPTLESPGSIEEIKVASTLSVHLDGHGVAAILLTEDEEKWTLPLLSFAAPYPSKDAFDIAWQNKIESEEKLRNNPPCWDKVYLKIAVPNLSTPYEESLWWDLYATHVALTKNDGSGYRELGWITPASDKLLEKRPQLDPALPPVFGSNDDGIVWPGHSSKWICLNDILPSGTHSLATKSVIASLGITFYSWITVTLSPSPEDNTPGAYTLTFLNDLEPDREYIRWKTIIK